MNPSFKNSGRALLLCVCLFVVGYATNVRAQTPAPADGGAPADTSHVTPSAPGTLWEAFSPATQACIKSGNCSLDDMVNAGISFAKFLTGLSAALFLVIFIYGGAMYLLSFGEKGRVDKGKKAIQGAMIGLVIVIGAWTIVNYVDKSIRGEEVTPAAPTGTVPPSSGV